MKDITIGRKKIGEGHACYIIAEAGVNHNGRLELALQLIDAAKAAGADCVKFQTYKTERIIKKEAPKANYQLKVTDTKESQFQMLKKLELGPTELKTVAEYSKKSKIQFLSTPYNFQDVDDLISIGVDAFKIASGQLVELPFLRYVAKKGKPIILSTGMASLAEVYEAVAAVRDAGNEQIIVLQCTTNYPSAIEDANIRAMAAMKAGLNVHTGYSDHVENDFACFAAVALGARVIEKHITLDRKMSGPDHSSSLDPQGFKQMVQGVRLIEKSLGSSIKAPSEQEKLNIPAMRRSVVAVKAIKKGEVIKAEKLDFKRPGTGLQPRFFDAVVGKKAAKNIEADTLLSFDMIGWT